MLDHGGEFPPYGFRLTNTGLAYSWYMSSSLLEDSNAAALHNKNVIRRCLSVFGGSILSRL